MWIEGRGHSGLRFPAAMGVRLNKPYNGVGSFLTKNDPYFFILKVPGTHVLINLGFFLLGFFSVTLLLFLLQKVTEMSKSNSTELFLLCNSGIKS